MQYGIAWRRRSGVGRRDDTGTRACPNAFKSQARDGALSDDEELKDSTLGTRKYKCSESAFVSLLDLRQAHHQLGKDSK